MHKVSFFWYFDLHIFGIFVLSGPLLSKNEPTNICLDVQSVLFLDIYIVFFCNLTINELTHTCVMMSWKQYAAVSQFLNNSSLTSKDREIKRGQ